MLCFPSPCCLVWLSVRLAAETTTDNKHCKKQNKKPSNNNLSEGDTRIYDANLKERLKEDTGWWAEQENSDRFTKDSSHSCIQPHRNTATPISQSHRPDWFRWDQPSLKWVLFILLVRVAANQRSSCKPRRGSWPSLRVSSLIYCDICALRKKKKKKNKRNPLCVPEESLNKCWQFQCLQFNTPLIMWSLQKPWSSQNASHRPSVCVPHGRCHNIEP